MNNRITIIGSGNGGQALAGICAAQNMDVCLYYRSISKITPIKNIPLIKLHGAINAIGRINLITDSIKEAIEYSDLIMVVTTATAHRELASLVAPYLRNGQTIVLNPGRTLGALEFQSTISRLTDKDIVVAEAQTLLYACRLDAPGSVHIIGVKDKVPIAVTKSDRISEVLNKLSIISNCFEDGKSMLQIGLENIGAIFHPAVVLFNAATIERKSSFYFYRDMTPQIASFILKLDRERLEIGKAYGIDLMPVEDWILYAYPDTKGASLCERMRNNPAYHDILGPGSIFTRQLTEDIPTGIVPMRDLGKKAEVKTPIMDAVITMSSILLSSNFENEGRTLKNLNLSHYSLTDLKEKLG